MSHLNQTKVVFYKVLIYSTLVDEYPSLWETHGKESLGDLFFWICSALWRRSEDVVIEFKDPIEETIAASILMPITYNNNKVMLRSDDSDICDSLEI